MVHDKFDDKIFGLALEAGAEKCFTKYFPGKLDYNLGDFFQQGHSCCEGGPPPSPCRESGQSHK
jgi:hypothetical protein